MSCRGISPCKKKLLIWLSYFNFAQKLPVNQLNYMYNVYSLCMSLAFSNVKRTFNLTIANDLIHCRIYAPMESLSSGVCSLSSWSSLSLPLLLSLSDPVTGKTIINEGSTSYYPLNVLLKISVFILQFEYLFKLFVFSSRRICFNFVYLFWFFSQQLIFFLSLFCAMFFCIPEFDPESPLLDAPLPWWSWCSGSGLSGDSSSSSCSGSGDEGAWDFLAA